MTALQEHEGNQALDQVAEKGCGVSSPAAIPNLTGPEQPALNGPIRAGDWTRWPSEVSFS